MTAFFDWLLASIHAHPTYWTMGLYIVFSNAVSSLAMPDNTSGKFYAWAFKFLNGLSSNISRANAGKIPGGTDAMPLPGAQAAVNQQAMVAKVVEDRAVTPAPPAMPPIIKP